MGHQANLESLGLELPPPAKAMGVYRPLMVVGNMVYASGHGPLNADGTWTTGCVGSDLSLEEGKQAARQTGLAMLATLQAELGSLDRIRRLVKTLGLVRATPEFTDHPAVINAFSELMRDVFGDDAGVAARSAVGAVSLPLGISVEIEAIFEIEE